jgi:hypothetical protein
MAKGCDKGNLFEEPENLPAGEQAEEGRSLSISLSTLEPKPSRRQLHATITAQIVFANQLATFAQVCDFPWTYGRLLVAC